MAAEGCGHYRHRLLSATMGSRLGPHEEGGWDGGPGEGDHFFSRRWNDLALFAQRQCLPMSLSLYTLRWLADQCSPAVYCRNRPVAGRVLGGSSAAGQYRSSARTFKYMSNVRMTALQMSPRLTATARQTRISD